MSEYSTCRECAEDCLTDPLYARIAVGAIAYDLDGTPKPTANFDPRINDLFRVLGQDDVTGLVVLQTKDSESDHLFTASHFDLTYYKTNSQLKGANNNE